MSHLNRHYQGESACRWNSGQSVGRLIEAPGTDVCYLIRPDDEGRSVRVGKITVTSGRKPRTLTIMRPISVSGFRIPSPAGSKTVDAYSPPGRADSTLLPGDYVAIRELDGATRPYQVEYVPAEYPGTIGLTGRLAAGVGEGADLRAHRGLRITHNDPRIDAKAGMLWAFGKPEGPDNAERSHVDVGGGKTQTWSCFVDGIGPKAGPGEPVLVHLSNEGDAGAIENIYFAYQAGE